MSASAWRSFGLGLLLSGLVAARAATPPPAPAPEIYASLRGVADGIVEAGEPVFVAVRLESPTEPGATFDLAPAAGTWADSVEVTLSGPSAAKAAATFKPATPAVRLTPDTPATGGWLFSSAATRDVRPGSYVVRVRLVVPAGAGWRGSIAAEDLRLQVVAASNAPERVLQRAVAQAEEALAADKPEAAVKLLDPLLATQPDNLRLLVARARASARAGDIGAARICVNRALREVDRQNLPHPPLNVHLLDQELKAATLTPGWSQPPTPAWTRLPASVLAPPLPAKAPAGASPPPGAVVNSKSPATNVVSPAAASAPAPRVSAATPAVATATSGVGILVSSAELTEAQILSDSAGQWAAAATSKTSYGLHYRAVKATGAPDVSAPGFTIYAWSPAAKDEGSDWLEVGFEKPVRSVGVRIRQSHAPGAIAQVEAITPDGATHVWWSGTDPVATASPREIAWLAVRVPATDYLVAKVRITLDLARRPDWKQIDAVQLVAAP